MINNLYTIAVLTAKDGRAKELLSTLADLADATRKEHGCVEYGFYRDAANENTVLSFERWVDADVEAAHWRTEHLNNALETLKPVLDGEPKIYKAAKVI